MDVSRITGRQGGTLENMQMAFSPTFFVSPLITGPYRLLFPLERHSFSSSHFMNEVFMEALSSCWPLSSHLFINCIQTFSGFRRCRQMAKAE